MMSARRPMPSRTASSPTFCRSRLLGSSTFQDLRHVIVSHIIPLLAVQSKGMGRINNTGVTSDTGVTDVQATKAPPISQ